MFRKDDRVWDFVYGWGVIYEVSGASEFPVKVKFDNGLYHSYAFDGKIDLNKNRSLFFKEFAFPEEASERPRFRAIYGCKYYYVTSKAEIANTYETNCSHDDKRFACGNYFETEEELKESNIYKAYLTSK